MASDLRFVARIDIAEENAVLIGEQFTRDDLEHVTYNQRAARAFVGSFDRNIYEIDPERCCPTRIGFRAPFKCRWVKTLERSPATGLVQCRNGGLYKVNLDTGEQLAELKFTPDALWTAVSEADGTLAVMGEGNRMVRITPCCVDPMSRVVQFSTRLAQLRLMRLLAALSGHDDDVEMAAFSPDSRRIATASRDRTIGIFRTDGTLQFRLHGHGADVISVEWTAEGRELISSSDDGTVRRWCTASGRLLDTIDLQGVETDTVAIAEDGCIYAGNDEGRIALLRGQELRSIAAHEARDQRLVYQSNTRRLLTTSYDRTFKLWSIGSPPGDSAAATSRCRQCIPPGRLVHRPQRDVEMSLTKIRLPESAGAGHVALSATV